MRKRRKEPKPGYNELQKMVYQARFNHNGEQLKRRVETLKTMRVVDGEIMSYGKFLHDYIRAMAFTYHATGAQAEKYKSVVKKVEVLAKNQWETFPEVEV